MKRLGAVAAWNKAEEITFECEPGTLTESKLAVIRRLGVTRLSLGVENFDDRILELNGRAHRSPEIGQAYRYARALAFPQINIDLIAGMVGETEENWRACIEKTLELDPDSVTIYQMELPFNTTISKNLLKKTDQFTEPIANWSTKRRWVAEAFDALEQAGYHLRSAYTAVKDPARTRFVYTDRLWQGADMAGLGVASFGHINGVHMQNLDTWETYSAAIERGEIPLSRAYRPTDEERLIRELVLQLKLGSIRPQSLPRQISRQRPRPLPPSIHVARGRGRADQGRRRCGVVVAARPAANRFPSATVFLASAHRHSLHVKPAANCRHTTTVSGRACTSIKMQPRKYESTTESDTRIRVRVFVSSWQISTRQAGTTRRY